MGKRERLGEGARERHRFVNLAAAIGEPAAKGVRQAEIVVGADSELLGVGERERGVAFGIVVGQDGLQPRQRVLVLGGEETDHPARVRGDQARRFLAGLNRPLVEPTRPRAPFGDVSAGPWNREQTVKQRQERRVVVGLAAKCVTAGAVRLDLGVGKATRRPQRKLHDGAKRQFGPRLFGPGPEVLDRRQPATRQRHRLRHRRTPDAGLHRPDPVRHGFGKAAGVRVMAGDDFGLRFGDIVEP